MSVGKITFNTLLVVLCFCLVTAAAIAQCPTDNAGNPVYDDGWQSGDNDGSGLGPWSLSSTDGGHVIGSSINNFTFSAPYDPNGDGDIDTAGRSWGLFAFSGGFSEAVRSLNAPLQVGDTFIIEIDNGYVDGDGVVGFRLRANGADRFQFRLPNYAQYEYESNAGINQIGMSDTGEGLIVEVTVEAPGVFSFYVVRLADGFVSGPHWGDFIGAPTVADINELQVFNYNANANGIYGPPFDFYVNSIDIDHAPLALACPADQNVTIVCADDPVSFTEPTVADVSGGCPPYTVSSSPSSGAALSSGNHAIVCTVTDARGDSVQCTFNVNVTVDDPIAPVLSGVPADTSVECANGDEDVNLDDPGTVTASDNCGGDLTASISYTAIKDPQATCPPYLITRTWSVADAAGNMTEAQQIISVVDTTPPEFQVLPEGFSAECLAEVPAADPSEFPVTDNCENFTAADVSVSEADNGGSGCAGDPLIITRTFTAVDGCNNSALAIQTITVEDTTAPTLACHVAALSNGDFELGNGPGGQDINDWAEFGSVFHESIAARSDVFHVKMFGNFSGGQNFSGMFQDMPCSEGDVLRARVFALVPGNDAPAAGNRGILKVEFLDAGFALLSAVEADAADGNSPKDVYIKTVLDATVPAGTAYARMTLLYEQNNDTGGSVYFDDASLTMLTTVAANESCEGIVPDLSSLTDAADNCGDVTISQSPAAGTVVGLGDTLVTMTASDDCGNSSTCEMTLSVEDDSAAQVICPAPATVECGSSLDPSVTGEPVVTDCSALASVTFSDSTAPGSCPQASVITRTWTVVDVEGNVSTCDQIINVEDTTGPVLSGVPSDTTVQCIEGLPAAAAVTAVDACGGAIATVDMVENASGGQVVRTWSATDECGNVSSASQTITIEDTIAPSVLAPADTQIECNTSSDPSITGDASASDNCDVASSIAISFSDSVSAGDCAQGYTITRTWTATDTSGNSASADQLITVADTTAPVIENQGVDNSMIWNEGFEQGDMPMTQVISNWAVFGNAYREAIQPRSGDYHLKIYGDFSSASNVSGAFQDSPAEEGQTWRASIYAMLPSTDPNAGENQAKLRLEFIDAGGVQISGIDSEILSVGTPEDEYFLLSAVGTAPAGTVAARIVPTYIQVDLAAGAAYYDDPRLQLITDVIHVQGLSEVPAPDTGVITATDACDSEPAISHVSDSDNGGSGCAGDPLVITRTYRATDACGNFTDSSSTIIVEDTEGPTLNLQLANNGSFQTTSFEVGGGAGSTVIDGWGYFGDAVHQDVAPRTGSFHVQVSGRNNGELNFNGIFRDHASVEGDVWRVSGYAMIPSDDPGEGYNHAKLRLEFMNASNKVIGAADSTLLGPTTPNDEYIHLSVTATAPAGTVSVRTVPTYVQKYDLPGKVYFDDVTCERINTELTYACSSDVPAADPSIIYAQDQGDLSVPVVHVGDTDNGGSGAAGDPLIITRAYSATDACGNESQGSVTIVVEDTELPSILAPADLALSADAGSCEAAGVSLGSPTTSDNCGVASVVNDAPASFPAGSTIVNWTVTDLAGNSASAQQTVTVTDNEAPSILAPADVTVAQDAGSCEATGVALGNAIPGDNCGIASVVNDAPASYPVGDTIVTWTVTDNAGLTAQAIQTVTVTDSAPSISAPADVSVGTDAGACDASNVDLGSPVADDNCAVASIVNDAPAVFTKGDTVVTWTVTDSAGQTATAQQTVTVSDNEAPSIAAPASLSVSADAGSCEATGVALGSAVADDNCAVASVVNDAPAVFSKGDTVVTWTVTDSAGLTATAQQIVTVTDDEAPVISGAADQTVSPADSSYTVYFDEPTAADNCDASVTVTCVPASGSTLGPGSHVITCTATDVDGNSSTETFTVTVVAGLRVTFESPLDDDNVADDIETDLDAINKFKVGRTIPVKVKVYDASGNDVTASIGPSLTIRIDVTERMSLGTTSTVVNDLPEDYNGVGDANSTMVLNGDHFQFNLDTDNFDTGTINDPVNFFRVHVTAEYTSDPFVIVGEEDATLESK